MEDFEDWLPAFSSDRALSVDSYFQKLRSHCNFHDLDARKKLLLAQHRCVGTAAANLSGKSFCTTSDLRSASRDAFGPSAEDVSKSFCQVKPDFLEPVAAWADRLCLTFQQTTVSGARCMLRTVSYKAYSHTFNSKCCRSHLLRSKRLRSGSRPLPSCAAVPLRLLRPGLVLRRTLLFQRLDVASALNSKHSPLRFHQRPCQPPLSQSRNFPMRLLTFFFTEFLRPTDLLRTTCAARTPTVHCSFRRKSRCR